MFDLKHVSVPLDVHFILCLNDCPNDEEDKNYIKKAPYSNAVGSLMQAMVYTRRDIAYVVSMVSRYMSNPGKTHQIAIKQILRYLKCILS